MSILLVGLSHHSAPVSLLEAVAQAESLGADLILIEAEAVAARAGIPLDEGPARQTTDATELTARVPVTGSNARYERVCMSRAQWQESREDNKANYEELQGKVGGPVKIAGFVRYALGEGIEKQESDFAAEVAAASGKK